MFRRGRSEEPDMATHRVPIQLRSEMPHPQAQTQPYFQKRAKSVGPAPVKHTPVREPPKYGTPAYATSERPHKNKANITYNVNPYQEFPSLRRGFTMSGGQMINLDDQISLHDPSKEGDVCSYYFWVVMIFLFCVSFLNLLANVIICQAYHITPTFGINFMEFVPEMNVVKFLSTGIHFDSLDLQDGVISGYDGESLLIRANEGNDIVFRVIGQEIEAGKEPELRITPEQVLVKNVDEFKLVDPKTGQVYFDMNNPDLTLEGPIEHLQAREVVVDKIMSPLGSDMLIKSDAALNIQGTEGIKVEGKTVDMEAIEDIVLDAENSIILDGDLHIDPRALPLGGENYPSEESQFKLCICMPSGLLFRVPVPSLPKGAEGPRKKISCREAEDWEFHPCSNTK